MNIVDTTPIGVCQDCLCFVANGDIPEDRPDLPDEIEAQWPHVASDRTCDFFEVPHGSLVNGIVAGNDECSCAAISVYEALVCTCDVCPVEQAEGQCDRDGRCYECPHVTPCPKHSADRPDCTCGASEAAEFSWSSCDCCGSSLGGSRHGAVVLTYRKEE